MWVDFFLLGEFPQCITYIEIYFPCRPACFEDVSPKEDNQNKELKDNQYQICNRFDNFGGGWGYSGHSVEAIRFSADTDVMICKY